MTSRVPVSVLVPIKNEAENLPRCLDSVQWADEIFVVDSQSTDDSAQIAERHGAKVVQFDFNGTWPKKKNWALENLPFKNEWVFILDADEVLPPEAETEFSDAIANAGDIAGYWINRRFMFLGRWLRHSYYPNWNLRLFRHALGRYEKLTSARKRKAATTKCTSTSSCKDRPRDCNAKWIITLFRPSKFSSRNTIDIQTGKRASPPTSFCTAAPASSVTRRSNAAVA